MQEFLMDPNLYYTQTIFFSIDRAVQSQKEYMALQHDVDVLDAWSSSKLLQFNPKKWKTLLISCRRSKKTIPCHSPY